MSYSYYLGKISKTKSERYRDRTYRQLCMAYGYESWADEFALTCPPHYDEFFPVTYCDEYRQADLPTEFYRRFDIEDDFEAEFYIMTKIKLKQMIDRMVHNIRNRYEKLENSSHGSTSLHIQKMRREWSLSSDDLFSLDDENPGRLSNSFKDEYHVFNLVHIFKTFDWDNDYLILSGRH